MEGRRVKPFVVLTLGVGTSALKAGVNAHTGYGQVITKVICRAA